MPAQPTVFEEPRSNVLGLPIFVGVVCLIAVASVLPRGIPSDTPTRVAVSVFAVGAIACAVWALRWRRVRLATIAIDHDRIVMMPRGRRAEPRIIARTPESRLRITISSDHTMTATSRSWYVLFDETAGKPRIVVDGFGKDRVQRACVAHGWVFADTVAA